ncbi:MAG: non-ribosomal peptide synthetase, partial [Moorea sp. SIO2I5]|nr:non-ribosomal peptide synthetase [Moorena sp. SIO2I5]
LPEYMLPSGLMVLSQLPLTPNGKVDRKALPVPDVASSVSTEYVAPQTQTQKALAEIWREVLGIEQIGIHDNFFDLGGHSLLAVRLMAHIQKEFQTNLPLATLFQHPTVEKLAYFIDSPIKHLSWSALVPIQPNGDKRPFFLVPGGGGSVVYYSYLARYLSSDQPLYGLQAVGLDGESEPYMRIEDIAAHNIQEIQSIQPQGPYLLGGHSFGGKVAFEMAQQLQKQGQEIALLAILDTAVPESENNMRSLGWNDAMWMFYMGKFLGYLFGKELDLSYEALEKLTPDDQLNYFYKELQKINFYPPGTGIKHFRGLLRVMKANGLCSYFPKEIYPAPITLFRCTEGYPENIMGKEIPGIYLSGKNMSLPDWGWGPFSSRPVEIYEVPGDHISMVAEPHVQVLAQKLMACIEQAQVKGK